MVNPAAMPIEDRTVRQSVSLPSRVARRVKSLAKTSKASANRIIVDFIWYKDIGSFKICGEGKYPETFLLRGQPARGQKL
jgi:hypothetical protein